MTFRVTTAAETAARFRARYERRLRDETGWYNTRADTVVLGEVLLAHVGRLTPKRLTELVTDVHNDFGECNSDRVARAVRRLVAAGEVVRTGDGYLLSRGGRTS